MKKFLSAALMAATLIACNNEAPKTAETTGGKEKKSTVSLPYNPVYSSSWSTDVSDEDVSTVLNSYKDWETGNLDALVSKFADTLALSAWDGKNQRVSHADLKKMWQPFRDSLSKVEIKFDGWHKMYATDKKEGYVVLWYKEIDTYKDGRVDSASWHDINQVKDGKISWYSQFRRPFTK
ncbi:MAG: nuclear transport factor 2 family protein [Chitinophagaceae bacterium]|jgi:ketosteroid isomerase-like protein